MTAPNALTVDWFICRFRAVLTGLPGQETQQAIGEDFADLGESFGGRA